MRSNRGERGVTMRWLIPLALIAGALVAPSAASAADRDVVLADSPASSEGRGLVGAPITFTMIGGGGITGPGIDCVGTGVADPSVGPSQSGSCSTNAPLGTTRDYSALPGSGYRFGANTFTGAPVPPFTGDCVPDPFFFFQCRVTVDKPGGEDTLVTFYPEPGLAAGQMVSGLDAAISAAHTALINGVISGALAIPGAITMPGVPPPGAGTVGGLLTGIVRTNPNFPNVPNLGPSHPHEIIEDAMQHGLSGPDPTLVSSTGAALTPAQPNPMRAVPAAVSAKKKKRKKPKTIVLGTYVTPTNGRSLVQPVLQLTAAGRKLLARIGALNKRRKRKIVPKMSFLQIFQPADGGSSGGAVINFKLKKGGP